MQDQKGTAHAAKQNGGIGRGQQKGVCRNGWEKVAEAVEQKPGQRKNAYGKKGLREKIVKHGGADQKDHTHRGAFTRGKCKKREKAKQRTRKSLRGAWRCQQLAPRGALAFAEGGKVHDILLGGGKNAFGAKK
jgi:hypothetical protein